VGYFCHFEKLPKEKKTPNKLKFGQSGHPDVRSQWQQQKQRLHTSHYGPGPMLRFWKYFRRNNWRKIGFLTQNTQCYFKQKYESYIVFNKASFFPQKFAKTAEKCDYNIDPS
jgi:hypothetical protein